MGNKLNNLYLFKFVFYKLTNDYYHLFYQQYLEVYQIVF